MSHRHETQRRLEYKNGYSTEEGTAPVFVAIKNGGADGTRTRDLRRDRPAF